jgi:hypothetical protein
MILADNEKNETNAEREASPPVQQLSVEVRGLMIFETVRRARRRILLNEILRQGAWALSSALLSLIVLLLLGTEILSWPWLTALPLAAMAAGAYLTWRRSPSPYQAAQCLDRGLNLSDTLSTAVFFATVREPGSPGVCRMQRAQAERLAAGIDVRRAIPLRMPQAIYAAALLALIASSLFALRYGLALRLDLRPPLARMVVQKLGIVQPPQAVQARRSATPRERDAGPDAQRSPQPAAQQTPGELDPARDSALDTVGVPDVDNSRNGARRTASSGQADQGKPEGSRSEGSESGDGRQSAERREGTPGDQPAGASGSSGLLGKFRDAMSSLLSRMRRQSGAWAAQPQASALKGRPDGNRQDHQGDQQGSQQANGQPSDSGDLQPAANGQNPQNAPSQRIAQPGQEPSTHQPGSGIGRQDGNKDVKLAEQLAAMGKISKIIGKRSASVTGELTVEAQNSNPQLSTPYTPRPAHHREAGGEISRDEVPVALQAYVQQYFEQVRKLPPGAPNSEARPRRRGEPSKTPSF